MIPSESQHLTLSSEDLAAYLKRVGVAPSATGDPEALRPDPETLIALHRAHALSIPFENLSIQRGELPIRLDLPSLVDKLVPRKRGGYCFEQNTLFQAVLRTVGFEVAAHEARVRMGARSVLPRTYMVLRVEVGGEAWLADAGFGGDGLLEPVPLDGHEVEHGFRRYRVIPETSGAAGQEDPLAPRVLQFQGPEGWMDLYALEPRPVHPVDVEVASWFT